jgi:hypothetical protein
MATTFNAKLSIEALFNEIVQSGNQKMGNLQSRFQFIQDLPTGLLDTNINVGYAATSTGIGASTTTSYDLIGGLSSSTGTVINFDEVVLIAVRNRSSTAVNYLSVGPHATNGFGVLAANVGFWNNAADRSIVPADSWTLWYSKGGVPAAAASTDVLAVITGGSASAATWDILILGRDT